MHVDDVRVGAPAAEARQHALELPRVDERRQQGVGALGTFFDEPCRQRAISTRTSRMPSSSSRAATLLLTDDLRTPRPLERHGCACREQGGSGAPARGATALEILGGVSLLAGWKTRWGAAALIAFLVPVTAPDLKLRS